MSTMAISAKQVAELRARTGAGMMDCKAALEEAQGDMDRAVEILRRKGIARAEKRADRGASQGVVAIATAPDERSAAMIELNCETDFVARNETFLALARDLARHALAQAPEGIHPGSVLDGQAFRDVTVAQAIKEMSGKTGEAMTLRRVARLGTATGVVGTYLHHDARAGALVELEGPAHPATRSLARELALHVAFADPLGLDERDIPAEVLARERRIAEEQVAQEGKPENVRAKIVEGKLRKFVAERTLLGQGFVRDDKKAVRDLVQEAAKEAGGPIAVKRFARFKVGEG
ncbi:MAG TPA: translation elongation factor Ts [Gemmatimonadales bacterium]|nr:translation elongation factor Ts [Gemmatimonadales bacterium]